MSAALHIGFTACVHAACFPYAVRAPMETELYFDRPPFHATEEWCRDSAPYLLRDTSRITAGNIPDYLSQSFRIGLPDVIFLADTLTCWPLDGGPQ